MDQIPLLIYGAANETLFPQRVFSGDNNLGVEGQR